MDEPEKDTQTELKRLLEYLEKIQEAGKKADEIDEGEGNEQIETVTEKLQMSMGVNAKGEPRIRFSWGDKKASCSVEAARTHGVFAIEAANLIELLALLQKFCQDELGATSYIADQFVRMFRKYVFKEGYGIVAEPEP